MPRKHSLRTIWGAVTLSAVLTLTGCANTGGLLSGGGAEVERQKAANSSCAPAPGSDSGGEVTGNTNIEGVFNYFTSAGYSDEMAAGIAGNIQIESSGAQPALAEIGYESGFGESVSPSALRGWGIVQWTAQRHADVRTKVIDELGDKYYTSQYSNPKAEDWMSEEDEKKLLKVQLDYLKSELEGPGYRSTVYEPMKKAKSPEEAADIFVRKFEIPANVDQTSLERQKIAKDFYDQFSGGNTSDDVSAGSDDEDEESSTNALDVDGKGSSKDTSNSDSASDLEWSFPVRPSATLTSPYGDRADPFGGDANFHNGSDFVSSDGSLDIVAVSSGQVLYSQFQNSVSGNLIAIRLDNGDVVRYNHMSELGVEKGDRVEAGDVIGVMGDTGAVTGVHLHFSVTPKSKVQEGNPFGTSDFDGGSIDPVPWLDSKGFNDDGSENGKTPSDKIVGAKDGGLSDGLNGQCGDGSGGDSSGEANSSPGKDMNPGELPEFSKSKLDASKPRVTDNETEHVAKVNQYIVDTWKDEGVVPADVFDYASDPSSCHGPGNALDLMVPVNSQRGDSVAQWLMDNREDLKVSLIIWKQQIWIDKTADQGWTPMEDRGSVTQNHEDHIHVSFYPCEK